MIQERRRHKRSRKQLPLKIADQTFDIITETVDISSSGIYCRVTRLLPLMSRIGVMILVPKKGNQKLTKKIKCKGVVVRSEPVILENAVKAHYNIAIFFTDVPEKDQKIIDSYLASGSTSGIELQLNN